MIEKIESDVDKLLLVSKFKKSFRYILLKLNFFSILKPKVVYLRPFLPYDIYNFPNFKKKILYILVINM